MIESDASRSSGAYQGAPVQYGHTTTAEAACSRSSFSITSGNNDTGA
jgi:hypothetical protein